MGRIQSYRDLQVWQRAVDLTVTLYRITKDFPQTELYGLTNQLRRAAVSIPSNIAEGHRRPTKEFGRFLTIALGSAPELATQIEIAHRIGYLDDPDSQSLQAELSIIERQLYSLINRIRG